MDIADKLRAWHPNPESTERQAAELIDELRKEVHSLQQQIAQQNELIHKQMIRIAEIEVKEKKVGTKWGLVLPERRS